MEAKHAVRALYEMDDTFFDCLQNQYRKWAKVNKFNSMLPSDAKKRKKAVIDDNLRQTHVMEHFSVAPPEDKPVPFGDATFKEAALEWLIQTDQVCSVDDSDSSHLQFFNMDSQSKPLNIRHSNG